MHPNHDFQEKMQQFHLETKKLTFLPEKRGLKEKKQP